MMTTKLPIISTALLALALAACSSNDIILEWRPYQDIDGSIQHIAFQEWATKNKVKQPEHHVYALHRRDFNIVKDKKTQLAGQRLGQLQLLHTVNHIPVSVIFLHNGKDVFIHNNIRKLANSRNFDFYEFANFRLTHAKFTATKGMCRDLNSKQGVNLLMTINYYTPNSFNNFYTALIDVQLQRTVPPKNIGYRATFHGNNQALQNDMRAFEKQQGKSLALAHIEGKASVLFDIICQ